MALRADAKGKPKAPIVTGWQTMSLDTWEAQPWERALGVGLLLGPASGNLGIIDVDDVGLADAALALFLRRHRPARFVRTGSNRGHIYVIENQPTAHKRKVLAAFDGRPVKVDLLVQGAQAVAPPTAGYGLEGYEETLDADPLPVPNIEAAWQSLARDLNIREIEARQRGTNANAPPLGERIIEGARNDTLASLAGSMRRRGATRREILAALTVMNERCEPPLSERELEAIARSVGRYAPEDYSFPVLPIGSEKEKKQTAPLTLPWRTARELAQTQPEEPAWIAPPYLVRGEITGLAGKLKVGKSTLTAHLMRGVLTGGTFLGQSCEQGAVLLLTEQRPGSLRELLARSDLTDCDDLHVLHLTDARGAAWPEVVRVAIEKAQQVGANLLVVDTVSRWAGLVEENDAGAFNAAMVPLEDAAAAGLGVWVPHHERKSGGAIEDAGRGSSAFGGAVDILLRLRRGEGNTPRTVRIVEALSRFDATPEQLAIELTPDGYLVRGTETDIKVQQARDALDGVLTAEPSSLDDLKALLGDGHKDKALRNALDQMVRDNVAHQSGGGVKGDPFKWAVLSFPTPILGVEKEKKPLTAPNAPPGRDGPEPG
ncbi:MAG: AAA family ATPase [Dehalococcoidia bacterium]